MFEPSSAQQPSATFPPVQQYTQEYFLRGAQAFDHRRERQSANRCAAKELLGVILATASQLPASMRTLLKAVNFFREPVTQA